MSRKKVVLNQIGEAARQPYRVVSWHDVPQAQGQVFFCIEALGDAGWADADAGEYDTVEEAVAAIKKADLHNHLAQMERKAGVQ